MELEPFTIGSTVEVSSDDDGFYGAWYVATVVDTVDASPTKTRASNKKNRNKKKIGYLVRYATLFQENNQTEPLTEIVNALYVRPLPPRNPPRNNDVVGTEAEEGAGDFQLYDVVDAYLRDGWWIGVVSKVIIDGESRKYLISFESPPEEVEFEGSQMRLHVDWIDGCWKLQPQMTNMLESVQKNVTQTSDSNNESNNGAHLGFTTPPKRTSKTDSAYQIVGRRLSAKKSAEKKSRSRIKAVRVINDKTGGGVDGSVKYTRTRRVVNRVEEDEDLHENLQTSAGVENSGSKGNTEDSLILDQETLINETGETQDGNSQLKRKRGRFQSPNGSLQDNQEAGERTSGVHETTTELEEQPLSVWYKGLHPLPVSKTTSCYTPLDIDETIAATNPDMVNEGQTTTNHHEWPFIKRSPIWATIESLELYQNISQTPHFSPLLKLNEDHREGLAIAQMVTFANVVQRATNLQWTDPNHVIKNSLETLVDLEANGFDVGPVRARLDELLVKKDEAARLEGEMKEAEKEIEKCNREKTAIDEEINGLERKMREVEENMVKVVAMKNVKDEEVMVIRSKLQVVSKRIADWKFGFEELVGCPL